MRLTSPLLLHRVAHGFATVLVRFTRSALVAGAVAGVVASSSATASAAPQDPEDILGELVVEARGASQGPIRLPKIGVDLDDATRETKTAGAVLRRDLALSAEFDVVEEDLPARSSMDTWRKSGAQAVVRVRSERAGLGTVRLIATLELPAPSPAVEITLQAPSSNLRAASHQLADELVGAYTGTRSSFFAQLAFVRNRQGTRAVFVVDPDGHNLRQVTPDEAVALSPVFGPDHALYYAASIGNGSYRLHRAGAEPPLDLHPTGSVYGVAFTPDHRKTAVAIARGSNIVVHVGDASFSDLRPVSQVDLALHPTFSPSGKLAYAGTKKNSQRIYVDGRAVSPAGLPASSPSFCDHPRGVRLAYAVGVRERADLVVSDERGRDVVRLTEGAGRNSSPACSPDGRSIAFFSTRRTGEGPGLYVIRSDGRRPPQRVAAGMGDSLTWTRLPRPYPVIVQTRPSTTGSPPAEENATSTSAAEREQGSTP